MKKVVAVLRGGPSSHYDMSLKSGANVLKHLPKHYEARDVFISKDGVWHVEGIEVTPQKALAHTDAAFIAMHAEYGEDGKVQKILETLGIPYNGSDSITSAIVMNKDLSKKKYKEFNILTPRHLVINKTEDVLSEAKYIFNNFHMPVVVKPVIIRIHDGLVEGIAIVKAFGALVPALKSTFDVSEQALVEEYISGREASCTVIDNFRGQDIYATIPSEYNDGSISSPANIDPEIKDQMAELAKAAHKSLGLRHYSKTNFIISPRGKVYVLGTSTLPDLIDESHLFKSLEAIGCNFSDFLDHVVKETLARSGK